MQMPQLNASILCCHFCFEQLLGFPSFTLSSGRLYREHQWVLEDPNAICPVPNMLCYHNRHCMRKNYTYSVY